MRVVVVETVALWVVLDVECGVACECEALLF